MGKAKKKSVIKGEPSLGGFPPTKEQLLIKKHYLNGENIMVDAGAGSSKTSTSVFLTEQDRRSVLYLAYNKAIANEAATRFPNNVQIKTFHGLAYQFVGKDYRHKLSRPSGGYVNVAMTLSEIVKYFNILPIHGCNSLRIASLVKETVTYFEHGDTNKIKKYHIPQRKIDEYQRLNKEKNPKKPINEKRLKEVTLKYAKQLWEKRIDVESEVMCSHDTYLKLYQLSKPTLHYDCIVGDEFQDVNPVVADIILNQPCQKVLIGDPNQSIYGWRGAKNYLKQREDYVTLYLSKSFRYGPAIAEVANSVINFKRKLEGFEKVKSIVGIVNKNKPYTKIYRTNGCLLTEAVQLILDGVKVKFDINHKDFVNKIKNVIYLKNGQKERVKHPDVILFDTYDELLSETEYDYELKRVVKAIENGKVHEIIDCLSGYRKPMKADVILSTGHKSKGLEWDNVILADDFPVPLDSDGDYNELSQGEVNLLYVCLTRAQKVLQINKSIDIILKERKNNGEK